MSSGPCLRRRGGSRLAGASTVANAAVAGHLAVDTSLPIFVATAQRRRIIERDDEGRKPGPGLGAMRGTVIGDCSII